MMDFREIGNYFIEREGKKIEVKVYPPVGRLVDFDLRKKKKNTNSKNQNKVHIRDVNPSEFMNWNGNALYC
jgi:hypothetical protein